LRPVKIEIIDGDLVIAVPEGMGERIARSRARSDRERGPEQS
jgi:hypothetical protein